MLCFLFSPFLFLYSPPKHGRRVLLIQPKQKLNPPQLIGERLRTIAQVYRLVQGLVSAYQVGRHGHGVVQVGEGAGLDFVPT